MTSEDQLNTPGETSAATCVCQADETAADNSGPVVKTLKFLIIVSNILVAVLVSGAAAMRYVFKIDLYGVDEFILLFSFVLYFAGAAYGANRDQHICADILRNYVAAPKPRSVIVAFTAFLTLALSLVFSWLGVKMFTWQWATQGATQVWRIPLWLTQGFIALCMVLMSYYFLIWFIKRLKECRLAFAGAARAGDSDGKGSVR